MISTKNGQKKIQTPLHSSGKSVLNCRLPSGISVLFKPDIIILGGGVMKTYYSFAKDALSETNGSFTAFVPSYEILQADPDKNPALVGAMRLFAETI